MPTCWEGGPSNYARRCNFYVGAGGGLSVAGSRNFRRSHRRRQDRLLYQGLLPGLANRYGHYLQTADAILDEPSVRIVERISADIVRMLAQSGELLASYDNFVARTRIGRVNSDGGRPWLLRLVAADAAIAA